MPWSNIGRIAIVLMLCCACGSRNQKPAQNAQESAPPSTSTTPPPEPPAGAQSTPAPLPKAQFFGGTVVQLDSQHITVSRTAAGRAPERRTFVITSKTRMSRSVRVRTRVTVRYRHLPEGDIALEIQIRPLMRTPRVS
jgi:hypothetical protein